MAKEKSNAARNIIVLFAVALVSVLLLAVMNEVTLAPIAKADADAKAAVYKTVYSDAADFEETQVSYTPQKDSVVVNTVLTAKDGSGQELGYVFDMTSKNGYGGDVQIAVGVTAEGEITAFKVIAASETPGLGAKASEDEFASQFAGLKADTVSFSKTGANRDNNEIDAISGATITTTAVTDAVNEAITLYNTTLKGE